MQIKAKQGKYPIFQIAYLILLLTMFSCQAKNSINLTENELKLGNERFTDYLQLLKGKNVGLVVNQSSLVKETHLVDTLLDLGIKISTIFSPEHGFRGEAADGITVSDGKDNKTGIPIISLYGKTKKPSMAHLEGIEIIVFDIQDVGTRFYTYLSTMHLVMEACAENKIKFMVLDKPNPNGHYVDGPVLELAHRSFVGMHPIPIVHGMTLGEMAQMINGEGWLGLDLKCDLKVVPIKGWGRKDSYSLPIRPSPNLPNDQSIALYPSLCLFEGTTVSVGRGTDYPFTKVGHPSFRDTIYSFMPLSRKESIYPKHEGKTCYGIDLSNYQTKAQLDLSFLILFYNQLKTTQESFFKRYFTTLAGTESLQKQIEEGLSEQEIRNSWKKGIEDFKNNRKKYLIYADTK